MPDLSLDTLDSPRFRKLRIDGNVTLTLDGDVLIIGNAPRIYVQTDEPTDPPADSLWIDPDATVWEDSQASAGVFRVGVTGLTLASFAGGIYGYRFDEGDEAHVPPLQLPHAMKLGSTVKPHVHLIAGSAIGATNYNIGLEFEYWWRNLHADGLTTVSDSLTVSFQNVAAGHNLMASFLDIVPSAVQGGLSSLFACRLKRVAAGAENHSANDIFMGGFDLHVERDTAGSRLPGSK